AEGRTDLAIVLWQKVLDEAGDSLAAGEVIPSPGPSSTPLVIYRPVHERVVKQLLTMPAATVAAYRPSADAEARAILAAARSELDATALTKVVRRYFLSTTGGQAALQLAGLALDRRDFIAASQLLLRLQDHPDFSPANREIAGRLAVAA